MQVCLLFVEKKYKKNKPKTTETRYLPALFEKKMTITGKWDQSSRVRRKCHSFGYIFLYI